MITKIVEATNYIANKPKSGINHGKFLVAKFDAEEWTWPSQVAGPSRASTPLLIACGWSDQHIWVLDLQTGEGGFFLHGGLARADLNKHRIWVCPLFEPFLEWLYEQDCGGKFEKLPMTVTLKDAPSALYGYRRAGPHPTVHILRGGQSLCGLTETPNKWPEGDTWVATGDELFKLHEEQKKGDPCAKCAEFVKG